MNSIYACLFIVFNSCVFALLAPFFLINFQMCFIYEGLGEWFVGFVYGFFQLNLEITFQLAEEMRGYVKADNECNRTVN